MEVTKSVKQESRHFSDERFNPDNMDSFLNDTITYFEMNMPKSKNKKLNRVCTYNRATNDKVTTLDTYYVNFINDCISELRKGKMVYVFKLSQLLGNTPIC